MIQNNNIRVKSFAEGVYGISIQFAFSGFLLMTGCIFDFILFKKEKMIVTNYRDLQEYGKSFI